MSKSKCQMVERITTEMQKKQRAQRIEKNKRKYPSSPQPLDSLFQGNDMFLFFCQGLSLISRNDFIFMIFFRMLIR